MQLKFAAQHKTLSLTACERLLGRPRTEVERFAWNAGCKTLPGEPVNVTLGEALHMLISCTATDFGLETGAIADRVPGLRIEAFFKLGEVLSNWAFDGPEDARQNFCSLFYASGDARRANIAPLLACSPSQAIRQLRFHSQCDVESVTNAQYALQRFGDRTPRFTIDAHEMAARLHGVCGGPLFAAKVAAPTLF